MERSRMRKSTGMGVQFYRECVAVEDCRWNFTKAEIDSYTRAERSSLRDCRSLCLSFPSAPFFLVIEGLRVAIWTTGRYWPVSILTNFKTLDLGSTLVEILFVERKSTLPTCGFVKFSFRAEFAALYFYVSRRHYISGVCGARWSNEPAIIIWYIPLWEVGSNDVQK